MKRKPRSLQMTLDIGKGLTGSGSVCRNTTETIYSAVIPCVCVFFWVRWHCRNTTVCLAKPLKRWHLSPTYLSPPISWNLRGVPHIQRIAPPVKLIRLIYFLSQTMSWVTSPNRLRGRTLLFLHRVQISQTCFFLHFWQNWHQIISSKAHIVTAEDAL